MTLSEAQQHFAQMVGQLLTWVYQNNFAVTLGEAWRTPEQAALNAKDGKGISDSLHIIRLAIDLNLFIQGAYVTDSADYQRLGLYWESLGGSWGGRFSKPDGNHFSLMWKGVR